MTVVTVQAVGLCSHFSRTGDRALRYALGLARRDGLQLNVFAFVQTPFETYDPDSGPCTLEGEIIGRGVPGLFYSEDLVLRDNTGFIIVDYRQPIRILEFLFGWLKAEELIGRRGKVMGWYRRGPRPYLEMRKLELDNGKTVTSYLYPVQQFFVYAGLALGIILTPMVFILGF